MLEAIKDVCIFVIAVCMVVVAYHIVDISDNVKSIKYNTQPKITLRAPQ